MTMDKFIEFLNEKQRDPRLNEILYPHYNQTRVREIIATYETDQELVKQGIGTIKKAPNPLRSERAARSSVESSGETDEGRGKTEFTAPPPPSYRDSSVWMIERILSIF